MVGFDINRSSQDGEAMCAIPEKGKDSPRQSLYLTWSSELPSGQGEAIQQKKVNTWIQEETK